MIPNSKPFDSNLFFTGGAGMFLQYHDVVKPAYLYAVIKMIVTNESFGLPVGIIKDFSIISIIEWYLKRRYINPLRQLDYLHQASPEDLDKILKQTMSNDKTIYSLAPVLNIGPMMNIYRRQFFNFPVFIYTEEEDQFIREDINIVFAGVNHTYLYGDLKTAIARCDQNFTYIFSDIEMMKRAMEILHGTFSHVLLTSDYRYNYKDNCKTLKYNLKELAVSHPFIRTGTTMAINPGNILEAFANISQGGET